MESVELELKQLMIELSDAGLDHSPAVANFVDKNRIYQG
jgi:hypothetical protein